MEPATKLIKARKGTESVFILTEKDLVNQAMHGLVANTDIRMMVLNRLGKENVHGLANKRPIPAFYTVIANTENMNEIFGQVGVH